MKPKSLLMVKMGPKKKAKKMSKPQLVALAVVFAIGVVVIVAVRVYGAHNLFIRQSGERVGEATWEDKGPTPLGEKGYTPQGLTIVDSKLIFANSWDDIKSRVYEIDPETMKIGRTFDMPDEAVHTSGLAWDGSLLWAVDYISNRGYAIELEESLASGRAKVSGSFDTTLGGTSACALLPWEGETVLAISDFMRTRETVFVRHRRAVESGSAREHIVFRYRNEGWSQGLEYADGFLYESENKWGRNVINKMSIDLLKGTRNARSAIVKQFTAPANGVEDLAWDGSTLWTSDETVFRFFRGELR